MSQPRRGLQYCPECGHPNPGRARFCMDCGGPVDQAAGLRAGTAPSPGSESRHGGTDWGGIAAAIIAFLTLRSLSRRGRRAAIPVIFLTLFFGCPLACGLFAFLAEMLGRVF